MECHRNCPNCGKTITHNNEKNCNWAQKQNRLCRSCSCVVRNSKPEYKEKHKHFLDRFCSKGSNIGEDNPFFGKKHKLETIEKFKSKDMSYLKTLEFSKTMSKVTSGTGNPMYGKSVYEVWVKKFGEEKANNLLAQLKQKHSLNNSGAGNPMYGKPTPQGSGNGWSGWYNKWFFRSIRELSYVVGVLEKQNLAWKPAEKIKINYINWQGVERTYRPDFIVENKFLVEIKPCKLFSSPTVLAKAKAAKAYCEERALEYQLLDPAILSDQEIYELKIRGIIKFTDRYEQLFKEKHDGI